MSGTHDLLTQREAERFAAMISGDTGALAGLLHDDLQYGHSSGSRETKASLLEKITDGTLEYLGIEHPIDSITIVGSTALVVGWMRAQVLVARMPVSLNGRTLSVWVADDHGSWSLLGFQPTPVAA